ncbi:MAG: hypothetical protein WC708_11045 [Lentisphaeria bacterium]
MQLIPTPKTVTREAGVCLLDATTAIVLDPALPAMPLEGPLALVEAVERVVFHRPVLTHRIADAVCRRDRGYVWAVADEIRAFEADYAIVWHARNKPSEYYRIREILLSMAVTLDTVPC